MKNLAITLIVLMMISCQSTKNSILPIEGFELNRYLGTWHEIVRLPHRFEKNLIDVTAEYQILDENRIKVINRGYNTKKEKWSQSTGVAKFKGDENIGELRVSFFRPFYGAYKIIELDKENYSWVMITSSNYNYFWILAREPQMSQQVLEELIEKAKEYGFDISKFIYLQ
jgi:apolipoprotein D and lipocalin family protein